MNNMNNNEKAKFMTDLEDYHNECRRLRPDLETAIEERTKIMASEGKIPTKLFLSPHECFVLTGRAQFGIVYHVTAGALEVHRSRSNCGGDGEEYYESWRVL